VGRIWSEPRGPGLPLDVAVASDRLPELAARGVAWQVLVPDVDAVAGRGGAVVGAPDR
jgi:hypothetical protein